VPTNVTNLTTACSAGGLLGCPCGEICSVPRFRQAGHVTCSYYFLELFETNLAFNKLVLTTPSKITVGDQHNISQVQNVMPATIFCTKMPENKFSIQKMPENMTPAITAWPRIPQDKASSRARRITASKMGRISRVDSPDMLEHRHSEWRCYSLGKELKPAG
jgi:hypothetical protein